MEHYEKLLLFVAQTFGRTPKVRQDFELLGKHIFNRTHIQLSATTLKRIFGYLNESVAPQATTLHTLARYVGYADYEAFLRHTQEEVGETQSQIIESRKISADNLPQDARLRITWQPNRVCVVRNLGEARFQVEEATNSKLAVGDTFTCHLFIAHEPLYLDKLIHLASPPLTYVCGKKDGIMFELLEEKS